jgi:hypothetical protein
LPFFHHPGLEPLPQQLQHPPVTHSLPHQCEKEIVIDRIKRKHDTLPIISTFQSE